MSEPLRPVQKYDFEKAIPQKEVRAQFILLYLEEQDKFGVVSERVATGNPYIKVGRAPTGLRDLEYSYDVRITHLQSGENQLFTRSDLEDPFTVDKKVKA